MKKIINYSILVMVGWMLVCCGYDNYEAPNAKFEGRIVYNGEAIQVEKTNGNPDNAAVYFELWEEEWETKTPIRVIIDQDGSFSSVLFNGNYKLVIPKSQGPFMSKINTETNSDTVLLSLRGSKKLDIEVMPYYMVRNAQFAHADGTLTASFGLEQIIQDENAKNVERVILYINKTTFVDGSAQIRNVELDGASIADMNAISLTVDVPDMIPAQNYVFARVGVKIAGVSDLLFSHVQKVQLQ